MEKQSAVQRVGRSLETEWDWRTVRKNLSEEDTFKLKSEGPFKNRTKGNKCEELERRV